MHKRDVSLVQKDILPDFVRIPESVIAGRCLFEILKSFNVLLTAGNVNDGLRMLPPQLDQFVA